ncbi:sugar kinase [Nocardioides zhouii]|uniref:sugar kinase n=1 Tax=Nocardioides zhouii TaxID=1168729 RepID=UPI0013EA7BB8|nr:sugar kinase [Nocardioides zhouii]
MNTVAAAPGLVTVGETMAVFIREPGQSLDRYRLTAAGAESNVAIGAAQLGVPARWLSCLGDDDLGHFVHDFVERHGPTTTVEWDDVLPTGSCVKEVKPHQSRMRYYRSTSAARRLDRLDLASLRGVAHLHLTGITPALSSENAELVDGLLRDRGDVGSTSFDINYRAQLWPDAEAAARALLPLARLADVVLVGDDEARCLLGTDEPEEIAAALLRRPDQELVLKRGGGAASLLVRGRDAITEPALEVEVVDLTGAGDAFAAGFLVGRLWGWSARGRLRLGHRLASRVVGVAGDVASGLTRADVAEVAHETGEIVPKMMGALQR